MSKEDSLKLTEYLLSLSHNFSYVDLDLLLPENRTAK